MQKLAYFALILVIGVASCSALRPTGALGAGALAVVNAAQSAGAVESMGR